MAAKKTTISAKGKKPVTFRPGALHAQLGVPQGEKIPAAKMAAAKAGKMGPLAAKRASFATGMLAAGRETAAKNAGKAPAKKKAPTAAQNRARVVKAARKAV